MEERLMDEMNGPSGMPVPTEEEAIERDAVEKDTPEREIDIFDLLPEAALIDANRLGFEFLAERGYDSLGAWEDAEKLRALEAALAERGEELRYSGAYDQDEKTGRIKAILIWYSLFDREGRCIARSKGLKLVPNPSEASSDVRPADE